MIPITYKQIKENISKRTIPIKYIVVHYTGNYNEGATPFMHYKYFLKYRKSSADFFIDDKTKLCINKDYTKYYTWAIGDNRPYPFRHGKVNVNSVHVEICVNKESNLQNAIINAQEVVRELMQELNIPIENVVRHFDCSGKICPKFFIHEKTWEKFKKGLVLLNWKEKIVKQAFDIGLIKSEGWIEKPNEMASIWFVCAIAINIYKALKKEG